MNSTELELESENKSFEREPVKRTNFFVSFCYLIIQVLIPGLLLFFLTSKDFSFAYQLPVWAMVTLSFALLLFSGLTTFIFWKFNWHQSDQFTYSIPFACFIIGLYLSSCWLDFNYFLVRFIIGFAFAVVGVFLTSVVMVFILRRKNKKNL